MYSKANLYYGFSEDIHPMKRIITASEFFKREKPQPRKEFIIRNPYSEDEAVNRHLQSDPPSFIIFGKPGLIHNDVASAIADAWNCVPILPVSLIHREIGVGTEKGRDIERILRLGRSLEPEVVMDLIRCRIKMRDIKHRGFVVDCLPFVPNVNFDYSLCLTFDSNARHTCPEFCENATQSETLENQNTSGISSCKRQFDYDREIPRQIDEIFTAWPLKPLIIIYLMCPKRDVASKRARRRVDVLTGNVFDEDEVTTRFNEEFEHDGSQIIDERLNVRNDRRLVRQISDMKRNIEAQCDLYERLALPVIDKWILAHDPQCVIRVDGRDSAQRILQNLKARLHSLAVQPSIVPKKMINQNDANFLSETSPGTSFNNELTEKSIEEVLEILKQRDVVSSKFPWRLSAWKFYCPVELAQGRSVKGKHAIRFLSRIYFLSSRETENLFVENPRLFLSPPNPRPVCKIAVFGPKYAGKSELCARLAEVFGGTVISVSEIVKHVTEQREDVSIRKADAIIRRIQEVPDEELEDELRRDGGYVVDGMCTDAEVWRKVVEANIAFEDVVLLHEDEPYTYLLNKFRTFSYFRDFAQEAEYEDHGTSYQDAEWEYFEHLTQFESEWTRFEEQVPELRTIAIKCNLLDIKDVAEYAINYIKRRFGIETSIDIEKKEEEKILEENEAHEVDKNAEKGEKKAYPAYIDFETAERLLDCGYYFLSPFGRWCPVQIYTGKINIQMFLPMKARGQIFPVVCPPYIYFLAGEEALSAFLNDPSKYLERIFRPALLPLRISIIGPPKCGKTTLANRFAKTYGMKVITRGKALRHMLKSYSWTESARTAEDHLRAGRIAPIESVTRAIEMISLGSSRSITQGFVLDGCPSNRREAEQLIVLGIQPMIVIDLQANLEFCLQCLSRNNNDSKRPLNFSASFLSQCYAKWQTDQTSFRDWLKRFSRNVVQLDATRSKWHVWTRADQAVRSRFADIALYSREANLDKVHSLKHMCVSPYEFRSRQSKYELYCPLCLFHDDILKTSGRLVDSQGMVQFREYFYWICPRHINVFVENPLLHLPPVNTAFLPDERPRKLEEIVDVEHACWARRLRGGGFCLVTYVDSLPDRTLTKGRPDLGVILEDGVYLFCSEECREKFLARHSKYSEADVELPREVLEVRSLPDVEFLKQTVTKALIKAVNHVAARRPKLVGLSAAVSAAIYIGVYLKMHNAEANPVEVNLYEAASKRMAKQNRIIEIVTDTMKKKPNSHVQALPNYSV
ncbi:adenylate kinase 9 isoform X1 [Pseudomyrmex gracilis]|uniref:adenylate kinase 9 isoform X1 n=1 Tax=Pseudomyrmex gracilis TaxID=219809 RepID=UPI000995597C|nr:adenylate kinase 9 isoform X1 [Pseudomyrmex gracilis]